MKNILKKISLAFILTLILTTPVLAKDISIYINNNKIETPDAPYIKDSRTLVPIRVISENLGVEVGWNQDTKEVLLQKDNKETILPIGKKHYIQDGQEISTDIAPEINNSRTFVPLRLIAELYGKQVNWDQASYSVLINDEGTEVIIPKVAQTANTFQEAKVLKVVDGDTIVIDRGQGQEKVRFILVDTPETKHPKKGVEYFGKEASTFTTNSLSGKTIYLQKDVSETDRYNRLLRYIWIERPSSNEPTEEEIRSKCFNAILLAGGYAQVTTFPPDVKYVDLFRQIQKEAMDSNKGLWGNAGSPVEEVKEEVQQKPQNNPKNTGEKAYLYANGRIIGNKNSMIYHVPTGRDYKKVTYRNAVFFNTEQEAQAAGYRRAKK